MAPVSPPAAQAPFDPGWNEQVPDLFKTRTPDSPAFVLLGVSPTDIQRPTTPTALAVSLAAFVNGSSNLTIPNNLALEVSPYWLFSHPSLTADEYASGGARSLYRMLTISLATRSQVPPGNTGTTSTATDLSLGLRSRIIDGDDYDTSCKDKVQAAAQDAAAAGILSAEDLAALGKQFTPGEPAYLAAMAAAKKKARAATVDALTTVAAECAKTLSARKGFTLDLAGGSAWRFPEAKVSKNGQLLMTAAWFSGGYTWTGASLLGMARFARRALDMDQRQSVGDAGLRGLYATGRFGGSIEGIYRHRFAGDGITDTYRLDVVLESRVTDTSWISVTFGKDFSNTTAGSLFSLANLTWGFGDQKVAPPPPEH